MFNVRSTHFFQRSNMLEHVKILRSITSTIKLLFIVYYLLSTRIVYSLWPWSMAIGYQMTDCL